MDKYTLMRRIIQLNLPADSYCVLAGGAMLFYGLREETRDIDLHVTPEGLAHLESRFSLTVLDETTRHYALGDDIELYVTPPDGVVSELREGIAVQSAREILALKRRLNRPKDREDIAALEDYLRSCRSY